MMQVAIVSREDAAAKRHCNELRSLARFLRRWFEAPLRALFALLSRLIPMAQLA
jgi:hypothetical protein